ncbi:hypothetical protein [Actinomadura luteofluorescens]|uniref:hypothetical protein n=1 Tax=Actinomadura luteofluorescens TaxID=46163 RepID=UPI0031CF5540
MKKPRGSVRGSGAASADHGGVAISGVHIGDVHTAASPLARSAYLHQVRRIAPARLLDRDDELAELADFCTRDSGPSWAWWQAPAWSGKSALLAWFVLNPPPEVRVVSFFVTARWAGNSDRAAFADVVLEQLAEAAGQPVPAFLTDANREAHLLGLLDEAAARCRDAGARLVLVVDGLDEDRGATTGPDAHSIAAFFPVRPPEGVRVVLAGRPHPPVPSDVPDDHPLRDPGIVRSLAPSEAARVVRVDAERELRSLLHGTELARDLLGLVVAAGGGLTSADLGELTGVPVVDVDDRLRAVTGRTFSTRASHLRPGPGNEVYVLAHEELQDMAAAHLGEERLEEYRQRLHAWADGYRGRSWPAGTPEYLLRGYHRLLASRGDLPRTVACGTDGARHDRMLDITGGDVTALAEIGAAMDLICAGPEPDLEAMLALNIARERLTERNAEIPVEVPAAWAGAGRPTRAEALAGSVPDLDRRARALTGAARASVAVGDLEWAWRFLTQAEVAARSIAGPRWRAAELSGMVEVAAAAGDPGAARRLAEEAAGAARSGPASDLDSQAEGLAGVVASLLVVGERTQAETIARSIPESSWRRMALADVMAAAGEFDEAATLADFLPLPRWRAEKMAAVARVAGDPEWARRLADRVEAIARSPLDPQERGAVLAAAVEAATAAGDLERAQRLIDQAVAVARTIANPYGQGQTMAGVVKAAAGAGRHDQAAALAVSIADDHWRPRTLVEVVKAVAATGEFDEAESIARSVLHQSRAAAALAEVAGSAGAAGDLERARRLAADAETLARSASLRPWFGAVLIEAVGAAGDLERARRLADEAMGAVRSERDRRGQAMRLGELVRALAAIGERRHAETIARAVPDPYRQARALVEVAEAADAAGDRARARRLAAQAVTAARLAADSIWQSEASGAAVAALASFGDVDLDAAAADSVPDRNRRAGALAAVVRSAVAGGDAERVRACVDRFEAALSDVSDPIALASALTRAVGAPAGRDPHRFADRAEAAARAVPDPGRRDMELRTLARAVAAAGDLERGEAIARSATSPGERVMGVTEVLKAAGADAPPAWARRLMDQAEDIARSNPLPVQRANALAWLAEGAVAVGDLDRAEALALEISHTGWQAQRFVLVAESAAPGRARRLLALALRAASWSLSLKALARVEPEVVRAAVDDLWTG